MNNPETVSKHLKPYQKPSKPYHKAERNTQEDKMFCFFYIFEMPRVQAKHLGKTSCGWPLLKGNLAGGTHRGKFLAKTQKPYQNLWNKPINNSKAERIKHPKDRLKNLKHFIKMFKNLINIQKHLSKTFKTLC